jgi:hypothetical protein
VNLLGVRVDVRAILDVAEHARRQSAGLTAVTDPGLLDRLLEVPAGQLVADPALWAETACQPAGVVTRGDDGFTVTRRLEPALVITDVIVPASMSRPEKAIQRASLFAGFAARWARVAPKPRESTVLEARLYGVGLVDEDGAVILAAEQPDTAADGWTWLLGEKAYRRWLTGCPRDDERASRVPATGAANGRPAG